VDVDAVSNPGAVLFPFLVLFESEPLELGSDLSLDDGVQTGSSLLGSHLQVPDLHRLPRPLSFRALLIFWILNGGIL